MSSTERESATTSGPAWSESERSAALHGYDILDTPRESDFDDLVQVASEICGTPVALVSLVDTDRQFFKAEIGFGRRETPILSSFCAHALRVDDVMVVEDAKADPRFENNPLVTGDPNIRFYAGAVMKTPDGLPVGTLCVIDTKPRTLDARQLRTLRVLARQAMTQMELRRIVVEQRAALEKAAAAERETSMFARLVEQSSDFIAMADTEGKVFFLNDAARQMVGLEDVDVTTTAIADYFALHDQTTIHDVVLPTVAEHGYWEGELQFRHFVTGEAIPVLYNVFPLHDASDALVGYGTVTKNVLQQKLERTRRAEVTREMAHRMKNTLAIVQAIVTQTFRQVSTIEAGREAIAGRLIALARAQDILTVEGGSEARVNEVVETALAPHRMGDGRFSISGPAVTVTAAQGLGLSLAIHELATNAMKYGALSTPGGLIAIAWALPGPGPETFRFEWTESGGPTVAQPTRTGFGSRLVERIVAPYFDGVAKLSYEPAGVRFRLDGEVPARVTDAQWETQ